MAQPKIVFLVWTGARVALALVLLVAGGLKAANPARIIADLEHYQLVSPAVSFALGLYLPWLEIATAAALLSRGWRVTGWFASACLGLGFSVFVVSAWARGLDVACGCFGGKSSAVGPVVAARAVGIFLVAALGAYREFRLTTKSASPTT